MIGRLGFEVDAIDVFCGYGGSSQGIHAAGATVRAAANHSALALDCHAANFPDTDHWHADMVDDQNPEVIDGNGKKVAGRYLDPADLPRARFAWFSPSCRHHSQANARKLYERTQLSLIEDDWDEDRFANSERSRVTMSCVLRYCERNRPELLCVENVIEVTKWGPDEDGTTFRWWLTELANLGYDTKILFLNSMFFAPCPQSRDRVYIAAWRKGNRAPDLDYRPPAFCDSDRCQGSIVDAVQSWKRPTRAWLGFAAWGKYGIQYDYRCAECSAVVHPASWMALSAIDFTNLGPTLGERKRLPAASTMERIRCALRKYWWAPPVLLPDGAVRTTSISTAHKDPTGRGRHIADVLPSLPQRNGEAVASLSTVQIRSGRPRSKAISDELATVVGEGSHQALALLVKNNGAIDEAGYRGHHLSGPFGSIVSTGRPQSLLALIPNRTNNVATHAGDGVPPVMTSATMAVVAAAGNTSERVGQTRARPIADPLFAQTTTGEFAVAALPTLRGDHVQDAHAGENVSTVSANGTHLALATWAKINGGPGDTAWHPTSDPLNTVTGRDTHGLVLLPWADEWRQDPASISDDLAVLTTRLRRDLAACEPFDGVIDDDTLMQVRFRMLSPDPELRRAMAFGDDYILIGNLSQMTAGLGNAVTPPVSSWLTGQMLATLAGR